MNALCYNKTMAETPQALQILDNISGLVGAIIGAGASLVGIGIVHRLNTRETLRQEKISLYANLMGLKVVFIQAMYEKFESLAHSDDHEIIWLKTEPGNMESLSFKEATRWMIKSEEKGDNAALVAKDL